MKDRIGVIYMGEDRKKFRLSSSLLMIKNIVAWTLIFILAIIATFIVYYLIMSKIASIKGQEYDPKYAMYTIISPSMVPNINVYDVIVSKKTTDIDLLKINDIITYVSTSEASLGKIITHRVIDIIDDEGLIKIKTQGDNNLSPDSSYVTAKNLIGRVVLRIPKIGRLQKFLLGSMGWLVFIIIPGIFLIIFDLRKIARNKAKKKTIINQPSPITNENPIINRESIVNNQFNQLPNQNSFSSEAQPNNQGLQQASPNTPSLDIKPNDEPNNIDNNEPRTVEITTLAELPSLEKDQNEKQSL